MTNTVINFSKFLSCPECSKKTILILKYHYDSPQVTVTKFCENCDAIWYEVFYFSHTEIPEDEKEF